MTQFKAAVIVFPGTNGDRDLYETFQRAGFAPFYHPASEPLPAGMTAVQMQYASPASQAGSPTATTGAPACWRAKPLRC